MGSETSTLVDLESELTLEDSLADDLAEAKRDSAIDGPSFLPNSWFQGRILRERVEKFCHISSDFPFEQLVKIIAILAGRCILTNDTLSALRASGLSDKHLPVEFDAAKNTFKSINGDANSRETNSPTKTFERFLAKLDCFQFCQDQWKVLSPSFGNAEHSDLDKGIILPFIGYEYITASTHARVSKIKIHRAHLKLDEALTEEKNPHLALKRIFSYKETEFQQELDELHQTMRLQHDHLTKLVASFRRRSEYFFILPWADGGNLRNFWANNTERRSGPMVAWVLEQMVGISTALKELHYPGGAGLRGSVHGHILPENILLFLDKVKEDHLGTLCISDPGMASYHNKVRGSRLRGPETPETRRRRLEYVAPELEYQRGDRDLEPTRESDMWSLGCVFLECIVWVLGGNKEVELFREARVTDWTRESQFHQEKGWLWRKASFQPHDQVKWRLKWIRQHPDSRLYVWVPKLTYIVYHDLLAVEETNRISANILVDKLHEILEEVRNSQGAHSNRLSSSTEGGGSSHRRM
ncbi:hypothetical protein O1611_g851 [Lasiodiplodia mahajangana]|uniref:Uncharacterized protein n=1 Tax=Lasiodiplodia mahajangana TaxID=1108764 RepID=A0ACC2K001_9PEZI|nr:hypothetical protein O1611_g851 [Lasiodiplodia mahajangana]